MDQKYEETDLKFEKTDQKYEEKYRFKSFCKKRKRIKK